MYYGSVSWVGTHLPSICLQQSCGNVCHVDACVLCVMSPMSVFVCQFLAHVMSVLATVMDGCDCYVPRIHP
jgi:hypothetical protein